MKKTPQIVTASIANPKPLFVPSHIPEKNILSQLFKIANPDGSKSVYGFSIALIAENEGLISRMRSDSEEVCQIAQIPFLNFSAPDDQCDHNQMRGKISFVDLRNKSTNVWELRTTFSFPQSTGTGMVYVFSPRRVSISFLDAAEFIICEDGLELHGLQELGVDKHILYLHPSAF